MELSEALKELRKFVERTLRLSAKDGPYNAGWFDAFACMKGKMDDLIPPEPVEVKPDRPPMLLAAKRRPFGPIIDWDWYVRSGDEWLMVLSDVYVCESHELYAIDKAASDPEAVALYKSELNRG